jgi:hypothetical protein
VTVNINPQFAQCLPSGTELQVLSVQGVPECEQVAGIGCGLTVGCDFIYSIAGLVN